MYDKLVEFLLTRPGRIVTLGSVLVRSAGFVMVVGLAARLATVDINALARSDSGISQHRELAQVFPTLPTWWIPESAFGFGLAALAVVCGMCLCTAGKRMCAVLEG